MNESTPINLKQTDVSVVIPVYRSQDTLAETVAQLHLALEESKYTFEVILIDDGSPDDSWKVIQELTSEHPKTITAIQLMRNFGQHNAIMCGFRQATGVYIVTMDDDLQNPPREIHRLLRAIKETGDDLVYGVPAVKQHSAGRNLGSRLVNIFFRFTFRTEVTVTAFRVISRELLESVLTYSLNFTYIDGLLAWNTQRISQVTVAHDARRHGTSGYSLGRLVTLALNLFTNFSVLPLQIASVAGLVSSCIGLGCGIYYLCLALMSSVTVPGYASIIVAVMVLGGVQLLALGVIGEYVGRLHLNVNRKPQYTIRTMKERSDKNQVIAP